ncbi:ATP-dependent RNA helicase, partial [Acrasis kona]
MSDPFADAGLFSVFDKPKENEKKRSLKERVREQEELEREAKRLKTEESNIDLNSTEEEVVLDEKEGVQLHKDLPKIIGKLTSNTQCLHDVALPPDYSGEDPLTMPVPDRPPAKEYPFVLDAFQKEAVKAIDRGQSVLVSAHTSAGKTAVAEYAIATSLRAKSRVVYTSPIKALSNQKFRELTEEFKDVGLMTGDVTMSPNASCVVMTTEILRSMLYRGSELLNEVAWVIFDEVHYMRDKERGVVWEETLILLPNTVRYVFLSATIPNALEFASWIAKLKGQPVHVVYTDYRPTPLQHYVYPSGGDGIHLVVDEKAKFREENWNKAILDLQNKKAAQGSDSSQKKKRAMENNSNNVMRIVQMLIKKSLQPVIVFSFSRKDCEAHALQCSKMDLNDEQEQELVHEVFTNAIEQLGPDDRKLPQVEHMLPLLKKGVGIHHSGLLPIIKEVIEILFQEGLVKVLFSTETFSMGLNMPARTVVFTSVDKFDGESTRKVTSGEYIQMSGRAGRRGIDDRGIVVMMMEEEMEMQVAKHMMSGVPDVLNSSFHLSYYMVLNLLRVEEITPEYIMERSFFQYQSEKLKPHYQQELDALSLRVADLNLPDESNIKEYHDALHEWIKVKDQIRELTTQPVYAVPYIQPGRLVKVREGFTDWGWGMIVNYQRKKTTDATKLAKHRANEYTVDVLLKTLPIVKGDLAKPKPYVPNSNEPPQANIIPIELSLIDSFSSVKIYLNHQLKTLESRQACMARMDEVNKRFSSKDQQPSTNSDCIPVLDPIEDVKIKSKELPTLLLSCETCEAAVKKHPMNNDPNSQEKMARYVEKQDLITKQFELQSKIKNAGQIVLKDDLKKRMRVLR